MDYYIGSLNGSGLKTDSKEQFCGYLNEMIERAEEQKEEHFDIFVEVIFKDKEEA